MHAVAHLLLLAGLGCTVVLGSPSLSDLSSSQMCDLCRGFSDALHYAVNQGTSSNQMQSVTVSRCKTEVQRQGKSSLKPYCSPFYNSYYNQLLPQAQNGHSTNSMCNFLCSSLAAVLQDYGVNQQSFEKETSSAQETEHAESAVEKEDRCETCKDIAGKLIAVMESFSTDRYVTPESVCREIEECPQLMLKVPSGMPAGFVEKLTALLQGFDEQNN